MTKSPLTPASQISEMLPPKPHFTAEDIPDQTGRVVLVTGGNTGIGYQTVLALAKKNAKVYLGARSAEKAAKAIADLKKEVPNADVTHLQLDLGSLKAVREGAESFLAKESQLDQLYCSAGVMAPPKGQLTEDGLDLQLGTNSVAHHFLIKLLLPALEKAAANSPAGQTRICITSSSAHHFAPGGFDPADPNKKNAKLYNWTGQSVWARYGLSKHCNVLDAKVWARKLSDKGIVVTSINPGNISTDLQRHRSWIFHQTLGRTFYPAPYGAVTQLWANTSPETAELTGRFLAPFARVGRENPATLDEKAQQAWFDWAEEFTSKY